jgi:polygalacturonase
MRKMICLLVCGLVMGGIAGQLSAQDMRVVTEPKIPPVCAKLEAKLYAMPDANGGRLRDEDESKLDTARIQKAMDSCKPGRAVELAAAGSRMAFLGGPLDLREGVTLLVDKGVTLFASRDPKVFEMATGSDPALCGTSMPRPKDLPLFSLNGAARPKGGCRSLININIKNAAVMGEGTIDGRGYANILGKDYSWWQMARKAQPNDDLYYTPRLILASHADGLVLYGVHLNNSQNFHVSVNQTNGFTAWGVHLDTPVNKALVGTGNDARNTDGIDPGTSQNVTVAYSWIDNGDDNIAVKQGVSHMSVLHNHFYDGHGMSIGSETVLGQSFLVVHDLTEDHTTSGIRIKSNVKRGGPVHDLVYEGICMRDVPIPIAISPYYTNQTVEPFEDPKYEGDKIPDYKGIRLEDIYSESTGDVLIAGLNDAHRTQVELQNVQIMGLTPKQVHLAYVDLTDIGFVNDALSYDLVKNQAEYASVRLTLADNVLDLKGKQPDPCVGKFVPYQ